MGAGVPLLQNKYQVFVAKTKLDTKKQKGK